MNARRIHPRTTRHLFRCLLAPALLALLAVLTPELHAQAAAADGRAPSELRLVSHGLGRAALVGSDGEQYGSVGWFGSDLSALEQHSAAAAERVRIFKRERTIGNTLLVVGAAVAAGSLVQYVSGHHFGASNLASVAYVGGGAVAMAGLVRLSVGQRGLEAALKLRNQN